MAIREVESPDPGILEKEFPSGALRSTDSDDVRFDLITPIGLRRLAATYAEGERKYSAHNWEKGMPASDLINHALNHINLWLEGNTVEGNEDHLAHAVWNLMAVMHFEEVKREMIDIPTREIKASLAAMAAKSE